MSRQIYVNVPVKDLEKSKTFFTSLGFSFNAQFSNETAVCMIIMRKYLCHAAHRTVF